MEILKSLEIYTIAQKVVGISFVIIGFGLGSIAVICHYMLETTELSNGLKIGALIGGVFILLGGFGYQNFSAKTALKQIEIHEKSKENFLAQETIRMEKVVKEYPIYQFVFGVFIMLSIGVVLFTKKPLWHGIAFSVMLLFTLVLIVEAFSYKSISNYNSEIRTKVNDVIH